MAEFDKSLNEEQLDAVNANGSVLLVACPGSGKTRTLIEKIARELSRVKSHREYVVALTYTHVAADEIRERIGARGISVDQLWVGTIHSFCLEWIIRPYSIYHESLRNGFRVLDTFDQEELLDNIAKQHGLRNRYDCDHFATSTGYALDSKIDTRLRPRVRAVIDQYHDELSAMRAIDFEMMLKYSFDLIRDHAPVARRLSQMFRIIAVDEYQDTREIQYQILSLIFKAPGSNTRLFMVGDPNQAIFTSLGGLAMPHQELMALTNLDIHQMSLRQNYRSSRQIVEYFTLFGVEKAEIVASGNAHDWQGCLTYDRNLHRDNLIEHIASLVRHSIEKLGIPASQICIVAPWWIHLSSVTRALVERMPDLEFNGPGLTPFGENRDNFWYKVSRIALTEASPSHFFTRLRWAKEIVDALVHYHFVTSSLEPRDFLRLTNSISVEETTGMAFLRAFFNKVLNELKIELRDDDELKQQMDSFFERMNSRITRIRSSEGVDVDDLHTFQRVFRPRAGVVVSTVHGIKGAEFDTVIAFALYEGAIPHFSELGNIAAAKRSLFVIGSRARRNLHLISERGRTNYRGVEHLPTQILAKTQYRYTDSVI
ncbi:UvrD-helicase domain-containing protein [Jonesia quinghaiensis]|uniref:UvrD-helicase domain-containing protein n=1 Tax=Jonesia quinghaiensis TaxID=262806 RepID=UPI0003F6F817|nr:ATP-dependent helicase [Jonesia quinghaiensis]